MKSANFFLFLFYTVQRDAQIKPQLKVEKEDGRKATTELYFGSSLAKPISCSFVSQAYWLEFK